jgi:prophage antirepressor-like protein
MTNIASPSSSVNTYRVPIPYGYLPLLVAPDGTRWLILHLLAGFLGLSLAKDVLSRIDKRPHYWGHTHLSGKLCLPIDKANELMSVIRVSPLQARTVQWLGNHACEALRNFTLPAAPVPLLAMEPELMPCPVAQVPAPAVVAAAPGFHTFNFGGAPVRVVMKDREPWWFAGEACSILDIANVGNALARLDEDEKGSIRLADGTSGNPNKAIISESGLYNLIIRSDKPEAKAFKRWIVHEVIPAIRKTGTYSVTPVPDPMAILNDPAAMRGLLLDYTEKVLALECKVQERDTTIAVLEPKGIALDRIATLPNDSARTITDAAKILAQPPRKFFIWLQAEKWIYRQNRRWNAYQDKIQQGLMEHRYCTVQHESGPEFDVAQPLITPKGLAKLAAQFGQESVLGKKLQRPA